MPMEKGRILDDFRLKQLLPTLGILKSKGAKLILISHLESPGEEKATLRPAAVLLQELLREKVRFVDKCVGRKVKKATEKLERGEILVLENLRLEKGEKENDEKFAKSLAKLGDIYINEAFSVCHRAHASVAKLPQFLPAFAGPELEKEVRVLSRVSKNPERPLCVIIGGAKVASKLEMAERFSQISDHLLIGGKIANIILRVKGICIGKPWPDEEIVGKIQALNLTSPKIHLPIDALVSPDTTGDVYIRETGPGNVRKDEEILDIGPETVAKFSEIIKEARTIFWAGPLGLAENEKFLKGTEGVAQSVVRNYPAFKIAGGGNTIAILRKLDLLDKFSFVSTGGGAMLAFLAGKGMPGIEALK